MKNTFCQTKVKLIHFLFKNSAYQTIQAQLLIVFSNTKSIKAVGVIIPKKNLNILQAKIKKSPTKPSFQNQITSTPRT